jgi:hypothetical protein
MPNDEEPGAVGQRTVTPTPTKRKLALIDRKWEQFQLLQEYKELFGTCAVHRGTVAGTNFETLHRYQNYQHERSKKFKRCKKKRPRKSTKRMRKKFDDYSSWD